MCLGIRHNVRVATSGRRSGSRRGPRRSRSRASALLALSLGVTLALVAWGYLVLAAIDFGTAARSGDSGAWWFLALACLGAVACLFIGLILVARLLGALRSGASPDERAEPGAPAAPRPVGGRRAAR